MATEMVSINPLTLHELFLSVVASLRDNKPVKHFYLFLAVLTYFHEVASPQEESGLFSKKSNKLLSVDNRLQEYFYDDYWTEQYPDIFCIVCYNFRNLMLNENPDDAEKHHTVADQIFYLTIFLKNKDNALIPKEAYDLHGELESKQFDLFLKRNPNLAPVPFFSEPHSQAPKETCYSRAGSFPGTLGIGSVLSGVVLLGIAIAMASHPVGWIVGAAILIFFGLFAMTGPLPSPATPQPALTPQPAARV